MGLGDVNEDVEDSSSSAKEYKMIERDEFEEWLDLCGYNWSFVHQQMNADERRRFTGEVVYQVSGIEEHDLKLLIFSSIDSRTDESRPNGKDSIKTVIWSKKHGKPVGGKTRTHRIQTWKSNLRPKVEELLTEWGEHVTECGECGDWMVRRDGQYGEFLGCMSYPDCDNTGEVDQ